MNTPLLSISVITYNHEKYLGSCLNSLLGQITDFPFEIVVGEDCSTDGTRAILKEFEAKYPEKIVPIYQNTNQGISRNLFGYVFPKIRGKYIAICDGDDCWTDPYKLQKQVDYMEAHPECAITFHEANTINEHGELIETGIADGVVKVYKPLELIRISFPTVSAVFRNHFREIRPEMLDTKSYDSYIFAVLSGYGGGANLSFVGASYRHHTGGVYSMIPKFTQFHWTIAHRKKMRAASIFNKEQKRELTKEIWRRKKLYIKFFVKRLDPVNALKILFA